MGSACVPAIDSLPPELLEEIMGFLDVGTLCTGRLVCAQFRIAASRCIRSVELCVETLRSRPTTTLNNFPKLNRVSVCVEKKDDLLMLAQSPVADAVTHLRAFEYLRPVRRHVRIAAGLPLLPLPILTTLTVSYTFKRAFPFPQTLRELALEAPVKRRTANFVTGLTNLTCLRIDVSHMRKPFEAITALTALQRLEVKSQLPLIPFVAELTLLTHLQFEATPAVFSPSSTILAPLASLARLHNLVHLGVTHFTETSRRQVLASIPTFTSLRSLDLDLRHMLGRPAFETLCMAPFSQLTALKLDSWWLDASFLSRFNLERLQDLSLSRWVDLERDGVVALRRATGLTHLQLWKVGKSVESNEVGTALSCMLRLRALSLGTTPAIPATAIGLLTELTRLVLWGRGVVTSADAEVCLGLKRLRVLRISIPFNTPPPLDCITRETFFAIAKLPELRNFSIWGSVGISKEDWTEDFRAWLDLERHEKGWPPLDLYVRPSFYTFYP